MSSARKPKIEPYVSPFVLRAKKKAEDRAAKAKKVLKPRIQLPVQNDWDKNVATPGLFDPNLKKSEIFRVAKEDVINKARTPPAKKAGNAMTMRTNDVSPRRIPSNPSYLRTKEDNRQDSPTLAPNPSQPQPQPKQQQQEQLQEQQQEEEEEEEQQQQQQQPQPQPPPPPPPQQQQPQPQQQQAVPSSSSASHPPEQHYNDIVKERLRMLLQKNRGAYQSKRAHYQETLDTAQQQATESQQYARDMMASMASIMKVVGDIVISTQKKDVKEKKRMRIRNIAYANTQAVQEAFASVQHMPHATYHTPYYPYPYPPPPPSSSGGIPSTIPPPLPSDPSSTGYDTTTIPAAMYSYPHPTLHPSQVTQDRANMTTNRMPMNMNMNMNTVVPSLSQTTPLYTTNQPTYPQHTQQHQHTQQQQQYQQHPLQVTIQPSFPIELQPPKPRAPLLLPRSKSAVLDMIMTKLQSIESCEQEIHSFLHHSDHTATAGTTAATITANHTASSESKEKSPPTKKSSTSNTSSSMHKIPSSASTTQKTKKNSSTTTTSEDPYEKQGQGQTRLSATRHWIQERTKKTREEEEKTKEILAVFPKLTLYGQDTKEETFDYMKELAKIREMKEIPFTTCNSTMAISGDTVSAVIFERLVENVAKEVELIIDDYANKFANTI